MMEEIVAFGHLRFESQHCETSDAIGDVAEGFSKIPPNQIKLTGAVILARRCFPSFHKIKQKGIKPSALFPQTTHNDCLVTSRNTPISSQLKTALVVLVVACCVA